MIMKGFHFLGILLKGKYYYKNKSPCPTGIQEMLPKQEFKGGTKMATQRAFEDENFGNIKVIQAAREQACFLPSGHHGD